MNAKKRRKLQFGPFLLDAAERQLLAGGRVVPLTPKAFDMLLALVEESGHLVTKDELMWRLWPDVLIEEVTLAHIISDLRKALKAADADGKYIETVPKRGYRFMADVSEVWDEPIALVVKKSAETRLVIEGTFDTDKAAEALSTRAATLIPRQQARWKIRVTLFALGLVVLGLTTLLIIFWPPRESGRSPGAGLKLKTLAVLPFKPLVANAGDEYLGLGITDTLITRLSNVRQIVVRPTSAVQKYAAQGFDSVAVGREQQVEAVLEGSLQQLGDKVRVTVRLLRTEDGTPLWAYQCDEYCTDIFATQDAISRQVARALLARLSDEEKQLLDKRETVSTEAYQLYLKGRYFWNRRNAEGLRKSIEYFEQAIALDPHYGHAFAGLSDSYSLLSGYGLVPNAEALPKARAMARRALELDPTLAEAHLSLGAIAWNYDWDWPAAEREFRRAIELNPNYATAHHYLGEFLTYQGRFAEGWAEIKQALEIDPTSLIINTDAGLILQFSRRYDEAIRQYRKALELDPGFRKAHRMLAAVYLNKGMYNEMQAELEKYKQLDDSPGKADWLELTGDLYAQSGRREEAKKMYAAVKRLATQGVVASGKLMWMHIHLGEKEQAFAWLEKVYAERSTDLTSIKVNPGFDPLRPDPRFQDILQRMHLAD